MTTLYSACEGEGHSLSLFCKHGFQERYRQPRGHHDRPTVPFPHMFTQGRLHCTQQRDSAHCFAGSYRIRTRRGFQNRSSQFRRTSFRSPRKPGRMRHAIGARPGSLTPSIHPKLGVKSRHQGLHRYALHRIFRPYLGGERSD